MYMRCMQDWWIGGWCIDAFSAWQGMVEASGLGWLKQKMMLVMDTPCRGWWRAWQLRRFSGEEVNAKQLPHLKSETLLHIYVVPTLCVCHWHRCCFIYPISIVQYYLHLHNSESDHDRHIRSRNWFKLKFWIKRTTHSQKTSSIRNILDCESTNSLTIHGKTNTGRNVCRTTTCTHSTHTTHTPCTFHTQPMHTLRTQTHHLYDKRFARVPRTLMNFPRLCVTSDGSWVRFLYISFYYYFVMAKL